MADDLYYVGDTVHLAFEIDISKLAPIKVETIKVSVFSGEGEIVHEDAVAAVDNVVKYELDGSMTRHSGDYAAFFDMTFTGGTMKTYRVPFVVLPRDIPSKVKDSRASELNKDSTDNEIETALSGDLRKSRRGGQDSKIVFEIAQHRVGKRLPK